MLYNSDVVFGLLHFCPHFASVYIHVLISHALRYGSRFLSSLASSFLERSII
uniref:Uncharacterized protein n=1 Tax=Rhizophora mucronata TaxID=61149 RepID=A0A2P2PT99_RHIMU